METGRLVKWSPDRGYGFIEPDGGGVDVFAHIKQLRASGPPDEGMRVEFDPI
jgi:CspA family cold shock protein